MHNKIIKSGHQIFDKYFIDFDQMKLVSYWLCISNNRKYYVFKNIYRQFSKVCYEVFDKNDNVRLTPLIYMKI